MISNKLILDKKNYKPTKNKIINCKIKRFICKITKSTIKTKIYNYKINNKLFNKLKSKYWYHAQNQAMVKKIEMLLIERNSNVNLNKKYINFFL